MLVYQRVTMVIFPTYGDLLATPCARVPGPRQETHTGIKDFGQFREVREIVAWENRDRNRPTQVPGSKWLRFVGRLGKKTHHVSWSLHSCLLALPTCCCESLLVISCHTAPAGKRLWFRKRLWHPYLHTEMLCTWCSSHKKMISKVQSPQMTPSTS